MANLKIVHQNMKLDLSTLGAGVAIRGTSKIDSSRKSGFRVVQAEIPIAWDGKTTTEGPFSVWLGINYETTEFANFIAADPQSKVEAPVRGNAQYLKLLGMIPREGTNGVLNNGNPIVVKPNWSCPEGESVGIFVVNEDTGAITTGTSVFSTATYMGVWLND